VSTPGQRLATGADWKRKNSGDKKRSTDAARKQHRAAQPLHSDVPKDYWKQRGPSLPFGRERFRVWWVPQTGPRQNIDTNVEQVTWDDASAAMTGTIQFRDPSYGPVPDVGFADEIMLECSLTGDASFTELWRMRIDQPNRDFGPGTRTFQLINGLGWLARSTDDFKYGKDKAHPHGWLAHEIVLDLCKRYAIPVGVIAQTTHQIQKLVVLQGSPLDVISAAYKRERNYTHKRFVISFTHGKLNITPLRRSPQLLEMGPSLIQATFQQQFAQDFATAVIVRAQGTVDKGKDKKGKKRKGLGKIVVKVSSPAAIRRYGFVQREVWAHDATTVAAAAEAGKRHLALVGKPTNTLTLIHPGIPSIQRGDAIRALLPDEALQQVIFVTDAQHTLNPGEYTMQLSVQFTDPLVDANKDLVTESRSAAARSKGRKSKDPTSSSKPKPKGANQRKNKQTPGQRLAGQSPGPR
jgi:hypothetical protein